MNRLLDNLHSPWMKLPIIPPINSTHLKIRPITVTVDDEDPQKTLAIADSGGQILTLIELMEILDAVKPFYDTIPDRAIVEYNNYVHQKSKTKLKSSPPEINKSGYVYLLQAGSYYKIGVSTNITKRLKKLATIPPFDMTLLHIIETPDMFGLEVRLHKQFAPKRKRGEWFELNYEDIEWIKTL